MIIMINGAFGVGKTTVASKLLSTLEDCILYDPECIGFLLRHIIPDKIKLPEERTDNFQDLVMWKDLVVQVGALLQHTYRKNLIVPMTIYDKPLFQYIFNAFKQVDENTYHFCLTARKDTIVQRLMNRGEAEGNWCFQQTDNCLEAFQDDCFKEFIRTDAANVDDIARMIQSKVVPTAILSKSTSMVEHETKSNEHT